MRMQATLRTMAAIGLLFGTVVPDRGVADAGAYLAARQATMDRGFAELAEYAARALRDDASNPALLESVVSANMSMGRFDGLEDEAEALLVLEPANQIASMATLTKLAQAEDYTGVIAALESGRSISTVVDEMLRAWSHVGAGDMSAALKVFDAAKKDEGFDFFAPYNKAMALALVGDFETAEATLADPDVPQMRLSVMARAEMLSQLERNDEALKLLDESFGEASEPELDRLRAALEAGETVPFTIVRSPRDGMAGVFFAVASALDGGLDDAYTLLYARIAQALRPDDAMIALTVAGLCERLGRYQLANEAYGTIPADDLLFSMAELGRANVLQELGKDDAELEVLRKLTKTHADLASSHIALGDALRRHEKYGEAAAAYSAALDLTPEGAGRWPLYFTRGIAYERLGEWDKAETDLREALALSPGQPQILNYLGYSFLEMKTNLDEAMEMIREAVEARPDDGYITDSLAWGLYRLRRYEEAVEPMERAAELMSTDPIINDHLGDVYWAVGREREARVQWQRALSFEPDEDEAIRIRRKLDIGLDRVLQDEGEEPTRPLK